MPVDEKPLTGFIYCVLRPDDTIPHRALIRQLDRYFFKLTMMTGIDEATAISVMTEDQMQIEVDNEEGGVTIFFAVEDNSAYGSD